MPNFVKVCLTKLVKALTPEPQKPEQHWIKFKIADYKGKPVSGAAIKVTLPDKKVYEATSDAKGMITINNIKPGKCIVKLEWKGKTVDDCLFIQ
jgi:hypothetical protein